MTELVARRGGLYHLPGFPRCTNPQSRSYSTLGVAPARFSQVPNQSINQSMFISQQQRIEYSKQERLLTEPLLLHQKVTHWCTVTGDSMLITIQDTLNQSHRISFSLGIISKMRSQAALTRRTDSVCLVL